MLIMNFGKKIMARGGRPTINTKYNCAGKETGAYSDMTG